jgi:hypothetical protein
LIDERLQFSFFLMIRPVSLPILKPAAHLIPKIPENFPFQGLNDDEMILLEQVKSRLEETFESANIVLNGMERKWLDDRCLIRYLKATKWNVEQALDRLRNTISWRRDYQPDLISPEEVKIEAETGKQILSGFDKEGRPLLYLIPKRENTKEHTRQLRFVVYNLEKAIKLMPIGVEKITIILDYENISMFTAPPLSVTKMFLQIVGDHYPEVL